MATVGVAIMVVLVWIIYRSRALGHRLIEYVVMFPQAVLRMVFGLALLWAWLNIPIPIYGTLWLLALAYFTVMLPWECTPWREWYSRSTRALRSAPAFAAHHGAISCVWDRPGQGANQRRYVIGQFHQPLEPSSARQVGTGQRPCGKEADGHRHDGGEAGNKGGIAERIPIIDQVQVIAHAEGGRRKHVGLAHVARLGNEVHEG